MLNFQIIFGLSGTNLLRRTSNPDRMGSETHQIISDLKVIELKILVKFGISRIQIKPHMNYGLQGYNKKLSQKFHIRSLLLYILYNTSSYHGDKLEFSYYGHKNLSPNVFFWQKWKNTITINVKATQAVMLCIS